jgi:hypothetical protein
LFNKIIALYRNWQIKQKKSNFNPLKKYKIFIVIFDNIRMIYKILLKIISFDISIMFTKNIHKDFKRRLYVTRKEFLELLKQKDNRAFFRGE